MIPSVSSIHRLHFRRRKETKGEETKRAWRWRVREKFDERGLQTEDRIGQLSSPDKPILSHLNRIFHKHLLFLQQPTTVQNPYHHHRLPLSLHEMLFQILIHLSFHGISFPPHVISITYHSQCAPPPQQNKQIKYQEVF